MSTDLTADSAAESTLTPTPEAAASAVLASESDPAGAPWQLAADPAALRRYLAEGAAEAELAAYYGPPGSSRREALAAAESELAAAAARLTGVPMRCRLYAPPARFRLCARAVWQFLDAEAGSGETGRAIMMGGGALWTTGLAARPSAEVGDREAASAAMYRLAAAAMYAAEGLPSPEPERLT